MKNNGVRFIAEMGIFIALGLVFDIVAKPLGGAIWPNGGSISIAMVPIFMMSFRYGLKGGLISGVAIGSIQILWSGNSIIHWAQAFLDYSFAYGIVGVAGLFAKLVYKYKGNFKAILFASLAILVGGLARTFFHIVAGVVFWSQDLFTDGVALKLIWWASATYNIGYMAPSIVLSIIIIIILIIRYFHFVEYTEVKFD